MPKISVIMGVYNTPKEYIILAIDSILNQSYKDFEFVICNDGCTDDTYSFIKEKYKNETKIIWLENKKNEGLAYTLNYCLKEAKGTYIARMDTDDYSYPKRLEKQALVLDTDKTIGVVNSNIDVFDENGIYGERIYNKNITTKDFLYSNPIVHPAVMVRKSAYDLVGGYRDLKKTCRNEDYDLFMRMQCAKVKMYTVQEKLLKFRENKNSYKRRKYRYRINEYQIKVENFRKMGLLPKYYIFCLKPLIVGLIPNKLLKMFRN